MRHAIYNFCTLFDSHYLPKGLILYESLARVCDSFHLYVFAFDEKCYLKLKELSLPKMTVVSLAEFETKELLEIKPTRNRAEYCWTCGPSIIWHAIHKFELDHCTYVDADLLFFNSPEIAYKEIEETHASVAITEHFLPKEDLAGKYCVQFMYFKNDKDGIEALQWWRDSCIEWCYARYEDGKFGDQKYLEQFSDKFQNVYVLKNRGVGVAPWNMNQYTYADNYTFSFSGEQFQVVFFHYHGVKVNLQHSDLVLKLVTYDISNKIEEVFYKPFLQAHKLVYESYLGVNVERLIVEKRSWYKRLYSLLKQILKKNKIVRYLYFSVFKIKNR